MTLDITQMPTTRHHEDPIIDCVVVDESHLQYDESVGFQMLLVNSKNAFNRFMYTGAYMRWSLKTHHGTQKYVLPRGSNPPPPTPTSIKI